MKEYLLVDYVDGTEKISEYVYSIDTLKEGYIFEKACQFQILERHEDRIIAAWENGAMAEIVRNGKTEYLFRHDLSFDGVSEYPTVEILSFRWIF